MIPAIVTTLAGKGFSLLADAVMTKGKEVVEDTLKVKLDNLDSEAKIRKLKQMEFDHEERLREMALDSKKLDHVLVEKEMEQVTARWESDNKHGTHFSKHFRPGALSALTIVFIAMIFLDGNIITIKDAYQSIMQSLLLTGYGAYFGARTVEKIKGKHDVR